MAVAQDGCIISNDNYRDLASQNENWKHVIESRVIGFTWFENMIWFPTDPYGKRGPSFLPQFSAFTTEPSVLRKRIH